MKIIYAKNVLFFWTTPDCTQVLPLGLAKELPKGKQRKHLDKLQSAI